MRSNTRRQFLRLAALGATASLPNLSMMTAKAESSGDYKALVCVFLSGGNDGNNTVVPMGGLAQDDYLAERGVRAIDPLTAHTIGSSVHPTYGNQEWGLHPSLSYMGSLATQGRLAVAPNVGPLVTPVTKEQYQNKTEALPNRLFSHSDQVAIMQTAHPTHHSSSGWAGRAADLVVHLNDSSVFPPGVSFAGSSLLVSGDVTVPASLRPGYQLSLLGSTSSNGPARNLALQELLDFDSGFAMVQRANQTLTDGLEVGQLIQNALELNPPSLAEFPNTSLGKQLKEVAKLIYIRGDLGMCRQCFFVQKGGFDTHSNQLTTHAALLADVDASIAAFYDSLTAMRAVNDVVTFTESDFARTFQFNANAGTDHGWGQPLCAFGGPVNGGIYGQFPTLQKTGPDSTDSRGRWIPSAAVDEFGATIAQWFGVDEADLTTVFPHLPNFTTNGLGFIA
jgi:uncharacterized protein (DUF1501 family)